MNAREWLGETNQLGIDIWNKKYRYNNETFDEWVDRVSGQDENIKKLIIEKKFLFGGRILAGRGISDEECKRSLSNCYVADPPEDNLESIFDTGKQIARTFSYGGGIGVDISKLSPRGAKIRNAAKETSGAVSFMDLYSLITGLIAQNGRRGALLISMNVDHPDIEEFITVKSDLNRVTKANISVKVTDKFMEAVDRDEDFELYFKRNETGEEIQKTVRAKDLFYLICKEAWDNAEPGVLFWDRLTKYNLMEYDENYQLAGTNPCGEVPLPAGGACLLGSINLSEFVKDDKTFDKESFIKTIGYVIRALNDVLDEGLLRHPIPIQGETAHIWRPIGLGIMGLADMLIKMEIKYGSIESIRLCKDIGNVLAQYAIGFSLDEAERREAFPVCDKTDILNSTFFKRHALPGFNSRMMENGIRNSQLISIAPCGTIATMLGISSGIEPIFDLYYKRKTETLNNEDKYYKIYTQIVWDYMQKHGLKEGEEDQLPDYFVTARDIDYKDRVAMQATWQWHVDNSISSTVNLPESVTVEDVMDLYMSAWREGCKGITIFREGCKRAPILDSGKKKSEDKTENNTPGKLLVDMVNNAKEKIEAGVENFKSDMNNLLTKSGYPEKPPYLTEIPPSDKNKDIPDNEVLRYTIPAFPKPKFGNTIERGEIIKAPDNSIGKKRTLQTGCGTLHCQAFFDIETGDLLETYLSKGSKGGCNNFMVGLSRMISLSARAGVNVYDIADQLHSAGVCPSYARRRATHKDTSKGSSCPVAVGYALIEMYEDVQEEIKLGVNKNSPLFDIIKELEEKHIDVYSILENVLDKEESKELEKRGYDKFSTGHPLLLTKTPKFIKNMSNEDIDLIKEAMNQDPTFKKRLMSCENCQKECDSRKENRDLSIANNDDSSEPKCPECGGSLVFEGGCNICRQCGWSKCD